VNRPIVLGPMKTVKTRSFVETVVWTVSKHNGSRYEGLLVIIFTSQLRFFQLLNTIEYSLATGF